MKTRDKIIRAAIRLYNEKGLSNVTSRHIGAEIEISHGNLEYHFPNKEALLLAIYLQMREEISLFYEGQNIDNFNPIEHLHKLLVRLEEFQNKYRFFCLDVMDICRKFRKVNQVLENNMLIRKDQMSNLFNNLIEFEYMKNEPTAGYYNRLQHTIRILISFWKHQEVILRQFDFDNNGEMVRHIWELIIPHLTKKGTAEFENCTK